MWRKNAKTREKQHNFEKLLETAGWELFAIAVITFLPAAILGVGASALAIGLSGGTIAFEWSRIPLAILWTFIVVLIAALPSVKILSLKAPVTLLNNLQKLLFLVSKKPSF